MRIPSSLRLRAVGRPARRVAIGGVALVAAFGGAALAVVPDFAQAWHWLDASTRSVEAHRVLRDGGRWAGWWSHARADDKSWFDAYWSIIERSCPGTHRGQRDIDWGATVAESGLFDLDDRVVVPWMREISVDAWMTDQTSHSYVAALPDSDRDRLSRSLRRVIDESFPDGTMTVRYETWLWTGTKT